MAVAIPAGVIVAWPSTAASIPANWTRVTDLDDRWVKGSPNGVDPDATGGADTHLHTAQNHNHTIAAHAHTSNPTSGSQDHSVTLEINGGNSFDSAHNHTVPNTSNSSSSSYDNTAGTWQTASNHPAWWRVIWIESDGTPLGLPDESVCYWPTSSLPTSWTLEANGKNAFLRGAAAGGDGGGTGGGGSHVHVADSHTHGSGAHTHPVVTSGAGSGAGGSGSSFVDSAQGFAGFGHTHQVTLTGGVSSSSASADSGSATPEPVWQKLATIKNGTGGVDLQPLMICKWLGLLSAIPVNWALCDGTVSTPDLRDKFVKGANILAEIDDTGGAANHDHADPTTHTHANHSHLYTTSFGNPNTPVTGDGTPSQSTVGSQIHGHVGSSAVTALASGTGAQTVDVATHEPPFRTTAFIQFLGDVEINIDAPTHQQAIGSPNFTIDWSLPNLELQNDFLVEVFDNPSGSGDPIYSSGVIVSATEEHDMATPNDLINLTTYYVRVTIHDSDSALGISDFREFSTSWTPPAAITSLAVAPRGGT